MLKKFERDVIASFCDSVGKSMHFRWRNVIKNWQEISIDRDGYLGL